MDTERDREAMRRRLYRPGASEEDRLAYAGTLEAAPPEPGPAPRRRRRFGAVAAALVGALAVVLAILIGRAAVAPAAVSAPPAPTATTVLPTQRVAVSVDGLATTGLRIRGSGSAEVPLDVAEASFDGGRLTVLLGSSDGRAVGWTARALETRRDWSSYRRTVASSPARDREGAPRAETVRYAGAPPRWIAVQAPADAGWTLTVAFTAGSDAALH